MQFLILNGHSLLLLPHGYILQEVQILLLPYLNGMVQYLKDGLLWRWAMAYLLHPDGEVVVLAGDGEGSNGSWQHPDQCR